MRTHSSLVRLTKHDQHTIFYALHTSDIKITLSVKLNCVVTERVGRVQSNYFNRAVTMMAYQEIDRHTRQDKIETIYVTELTMRKNWRKS